MNTMTLQKLIDKKLGIVTWLMEPQYIPGQPKGFRFVAGKQDLRAGDGEFLACYTIEGAESGSSFSLNRENARDQAIGECIERYCPSFIDESKTFFSKTFNELSGYKISPSAFQAFADEELQVTPFRRVSHDQKLDWVKGYDMVFEREVLLPAEVVYFPYKAHLREGITTGLACGQSYDSAALSGLLECIERDAIMMMWRNQLSMPLICLEELKEVCPDKALLSLIDECHQCHFDVFLVDITNDIKAPTVFCVLKNKLEKTPYVLIGASCKLSIFAAIRKALEEALQGLGMLGFISSDEPIYPTDRKQVKYPHEFMLYYTGGHELEKLDFITASTQKADLNQYMMNDLHDMIKHFHEKNLAAIVVDVTTKDVKDAGLHVVRVVTPELVFLDFRYPATNYRRLHEVPERIGYARRTPFNKDFHPFP